MSDGKFDEMLKKALREACMQDAEVMFSSGFIVPSAALLHRQEKMLKKPAAYAKKNSLPTWKRAVRAAAVAIFLFIGSIGIMMAVNEEIRADIIQWLVQWREEYVDFTFWSRDKVEISDNWTVEGLPEGYFMDSMDRVGQNLFIIYRNNKGDEISLDCVTIEEGTAYLSDTEDYYISEVKIADMDGTIFLSDLKTDYVVWQDQRRRIFFALWADVDQDELIRLAESVCEK